MRSGAVAYSDVFYPATERAAALAPGPELRCGSFTKLKFNRKPRYSRDAPVAVAEDSGC